MSDDNINRIISVILFRGNTGCSWSTRPNYKNIVLMNNRLLIFLVAFFCKIDPITIFHMHFTNIQRAKCRNAFIRIILRRLNYHAHAYICYITNSATRPFIKLVFRTKQFDKSGLDELFHRLKLFSSRGNSVINAAESFGNLLLIFNVIRRYWCCFQHFFTDSLKSTACSLGN